MEIRRHNIVQFKRALVYYANTLSLQDLQHTKRTYVNEYITIWASKVLDMVLISSRESLRVARNCWRLLMRVVLIRTLIYFVKSGRNKLYLAHLANLSQIVGLRVLFWGCKWIRLIYISGQGPSVCQVNKHKTTNQQQYKMRNWLIYTHKKTQSYNFNSLRPRSKLSSKCFITWWLFQCYIYNYNLFISLKTIYHFPFKHGCIASWNFFRLFEHNIPLLA